jgi:hypothetical protein
VAAWWCGSHFVFHQRLRVERIAESPLHFACAPSRLQSHSGSMARKRNDEPTKRTAAYRNLLQREDLTMKMVRRRTTFVLVGWIAALALAGWLLAYFA